jgi:hypothetical protein
MKFTYDEIYSRLLKGNGINCPVCGKPMYMKQKAHILGQGERSRKLWGNEIIDYPLNSFDVCSLECNNAIQLNPGSRPEECRKHAAFILSQILKKGGK